MSDPFIGEIRMFAGTFAPRNFAFCDGQLLSALQYDALFSLLGTIYGGDGRTTFGLPDMRGRIPVHPGEGRGLSQIIQGQKAGGYSSVEMTTDITTTRGVVVNKNRQSVLSSRGHQPSLCINFIIALTGIYPSPS
jgi:microcystin-dependent protein